MLRGVFVTGTDTNVGKTVVSAALMHCYRDAAPLCYWKPIQTGTSADDDTATVRSLGACAELEIFDSGVRLPAPLSPDRAAQLAGQTIELDDLIRLLPAASSTRRWIVEGAGGVLVPISDLHLMTHLIERLSLTVVVVARTALGTINHTLLTLEALRSRSIRVAGVVMVGESNPDNRKAIEKYGSVSVLGEMPYFTSLDTETLGCWARTHLDTGGRLREFLHD